MDRPPARLITKIDTSIASKAFKFQYEGQELVISSLELTTYIFNYFEKLVKLISEKIGFSSNNYGFDEDQLRMIDVYGKVDKHEKHINISDKFTLKNSPIDWLVESRYLKQSKTRSPSMPTTINSKIERLGIRLGLSEKDFISKYGNSKSSDALRTRYIEYVIEKVTNLPESELPKELVKVRFYEMAGFVIGIPTPSFRYATCWGERKDIDKRIKLIEITLGQSATTGSTQSESKYNLPPDLSDAQMQAIILILKKFSKRKNKERLKTEKAIEQLQDFLNINPDNSYPALCRAIKELKKNNTISDKQIINTIRSILMGQEIDCPDASIPIMVAAWFLSEVSRYPSSLFSSLILLDLIDKGICSIERALAGEDDRNDSIGIHPMCHKDSFTQTNESITNMPGKFRIKKPHELLNGKLSDVVIKDAMILMEWLKFNLERKYQLTEIENFTVPLNLPDNEKMLKEHFFKKIILPMIEKRLKSFEFQLGLFLDITELEKPIITVSVPPAAAAPLPSENKTSDMSLIHNSVAQTDLSANSSSLDSYSSLSDSSSHKKNKLNTYPVSQLIGYTLHNETNRKYKEKRDEKEKDSKHDKKGKKDRKHKHKEKKHHHKHKQSHGH